MLYSVSIYPDGLTEDNEYTAPSKIFFESKEEKDKYIKLENRYCYKQIVEHAGAFPMKARYSAKRALEKRRVEFAGAVNYAPSNGNKRVWIKTNPDSNDIA